MPRATHQAYGHGMRVFDVRFSPIDPMLLASASDDTTARVWRIEHSGSVRQVACCFGHTAEVLRVAWSKDGKLLATGSADGTVRVWEPCGAADQPSYDGRQVALLQGHPEEVYHVDFLDDNEESSGSRLLLVASSESLFVWDVERQQLLQKADAPGTSGSTVTPEELIETGQPGSYIFGCARQPSCAGGKLIATACSDGQLRLWSFDDSNSLTFLHAMGLGESKMLTSCAFDPRGSLLACTARDGTVFVLDAQTLSITRTLRVPFSCFCCCFLPRNDGDGEWLALTGAKGQVTMFDVRSPVVPPVSIPTGFDYASPLLVASVTEGAGTVLIAAAGDAQLMAPLPMRKGAGMGAGKGGGMGGGVGPGGSEGRGGGRGAGTGAGGGSERGVEEGVSGKSERGVDAEEGSGAKGAATAAAAMGDAAACDATRKATALTSASAPQPGAQSVDVTHGDQRPAAESGGPAAAAAATPEAASAALAAASAAARRRGRPKRPVDPNPGCPAEAPQQAAAAPPDFMSALDADPFGEGGGRGEGKAGEAGEGERGRAGRVQGVGVQADEEAPEGSTIRAPIFIWRL